MGVTEIVKHHGILKAVPYAFCRLLQRFVIFDWTHVMIKDVTAVEYGDSNLEVECRFLTEDEVREFARDATNEIDPILADRLKHGYDFCFGGLVDGELAGYCWLALHSIEAEHNRSGESPLSGVAFSYPENCAFRYKGFTHPRFRGQRIYQTIGTEASLAMQELGVQYVISTAEAVNYAALKSSYRCGFRKVGNCVIAGAGERVGVWAPNLTSRGIHIGKTATVLDRASIPEAPAIERVDREPVMAGL